MKGIAALFIGIFGTFAFSWTGLILVPNYQIGHLDPQMDEDGTDVYPAPKSGMAERGRRIYAANGCVYCHSQQVRPDYEASDLERTRDQDRNLKWGERRSAPRDYLFERPVQLGKMRMGPDLANIGKHKAEDETAPPASNAAASPAPQTSPAASPAPGTSPAASASPASSPGASPAQSPAVAAAPSVSPAASPATSPAASAPPSPPVAVAPSVSPPASPAKPVAATTSPNPAPANPPAPAASPASSPANAATTADTSKGEPTPYTAPWHHRHLYNPRSIALDSNMPAFRFLYERRPISGQRAADALVLSEVDRVPEGWEVVPTYDAKCLVAYLMSLDQSHALKEVKATTAPPASPPAPSPPAPSTSPAPAAPKEAK